jgi:hypothetical protein
MPTKTTLTHIIDSPDFTTRLHELAVRLGFSTDRSGYETVREALAGDEDARLECAKRLAAEDLAE